MKILKLVLMGMGAIWLLYIAWSYIALPAIKQRGSTVYTSQLNAEDRYTGLKSYCSSLGLASEKEGVTPEKKTTLFVGEHADLSNISIIARLRFDDDPDRCSVGYSLKCTYPRRSGSGSEDYKKLVQELAEIIGKEN